VHNSLACTLAEGLIEVGAVVLGQVVACERLTTVLVDTLKNLGIQNHVSCMPLHVGSRGVTNLVTGGVTKTGEQRGELAGDRSVGVLLEDDLLESGSIGDL
jgi:hypothetical protein